MKQPSAMKCAFGTIWNASLHARQRLALHSGKAAASYFGKAEMLHSKLLPQPLFGGIMKATNQNLFVKGVYMKNKKIITAIVIGIFLILSFLFLSPSIEKRAEWNKISKDYDIIAEVAFDYYNEYIDERNTHSGTIFLNISEDGESLTQTIYSDGNDDMVYYVALTDTQKTALKNITKFYTGSKRQEEIMIKSADYLEISDKDAVGAFAVVKSKTKPDNWKNYKIYNLGNDWWQIISTAR